jgi:serine protease
MPAGRPPRARPRIVVALLALAAAALPLAACGSPDGGSGPEGGTIRGIVRVASPSSVPPAEEAGAPAPRAVPSSRTATARWSIEAVDAYAAPAVPGEVIVAYEPGIAVAASMRLEAAGVTLRAVRALTVPGVHLYRSPGADPRDLAREVARRPGVRYAQPNYLLEPLQTREPDDAIWRDQRSALWHYDALDLPEAWAVTTGSSSTVVAVVDTGILVRQGDPSASHPDLYAKTLPGYDFISDPTMAGDGDGRDGDPYDDGDEPGGQPSYHGTHVAGTVGARANDGYGIPGVAWEARILPVRVLGAGGGTMVDIIEGALWAAGHPIAGVPTNPTPADVLNLSLGGAAPCAPYAQDAFDWIANQSPRNAVVVVAAGNDDADASDYTPAGCRNVIAVGASETRDVRAPYSNYGARIDVMAPGGDLSVDRNGDGRPDGVLSAWGSAPSGGAPTMSWNLQAGTSMAAPHVAGVVALMKALDPALDFAQAERYLTSTATPWTAGACQRPLASDCGAGLMDVPAALQAVQDGVAPAPAGEPLVFAPEPVDFGNDLTTATVTITNTSDRTIDWEAFYSEDPTNPAPLDPGWISGEEVSGTIPAGGSAPLTLYADRAFVGADGAFFATLDFLESDGAGGFASESFLSIRIAKSSAPVGPTGPMGVYAYVPDPSDPSGWRQSGVVWSPAPFTTFAVNVEAGDNLLVAWADENGNGAVDDGDLLGTHPSLVRVLDGSDVGGVAIDLAPYASLSPSGAPAPSLEAWLATEEGAALRTRLLDAR